MLGNDEWLSRWDVVVPVKYIERKRSLGTGTFGQVFLATCHGSPVAIKTLKTSVNAVDKLAELKKEINIMRRLQAAPNVVHYVGICVAEESISIIMEYVPGRNLFDLLKEPKVWEEREVAKKMRITKDIAAGCNWLHRLDPPIVHRDLKPDNILVSLDLQIVKICDFGLACIKQTKDETVLVGTRNYMAPEIFKSHPGDEKSDVFSFGSTIWEMWENAGRPFAKIKAEKGDGVISEMLALRKNPSDFIKSSKTSQVPDFVMGLIEKCWQFASKEV